MCVCVCVGQRERGSIHPSTNLGVVCEYCMALGSSTFPFGVHVLASIGGLASQTFSVAINTSHEAVQALYFVQQHK